MKKRQCARCGNWYYSHYGDFWSPPSGYEMDWCGSCNDEVDREIREREGWDNDKIKKFTHIIEEESED